MNAAAMTDYGRMCGWTLARAHARTGDRIAIAAYLGGSHNSTRPWPNSARPMPIRPNTTTRHWLTRLPPGASRRTPEARPRPGQAPGGRSAGGGSGAGAPTGVLVLIEASRRSWPGLAEIAAAFGHGEAAGTRALFILGGLITVAFGVVLCARPGIGAVTLALLFGLFSLIAGIWMLVQGIEARTYPAKQREAELRLLGVPRTRSRPPRRPPPPGHRHVVTAATMLPAASRQQPRVAARSAGPRDTRRGDIPWPAPDLVVDLSGVQRHPPAQRRIGCWLNGLPL